MNATSIAILSVFALCALLLLAAIAVERATRQIGPPLGVPPPTGRCPRCARGNLAIDRWGRPLPHFPHTRAQTICVSRRPVE